MKAPSDGDHSRRNRKYRVYDFKARPTPSVAPDDFNVNPFSSQGRIDLQTFLLTMLMIVASLYLVEFVTRGPLQSARVGLDAQTAGLYYGVRFFSCMIGFWMVSSAFIKRWKDILRKPVGPFLRSLFRLMLLSPLLSIWFTLFTLVNGRSLRGVRWLAAAASLIVFHAAVLGYYVSQDEIAVGPGAMAHLKGIPSAEQVLKKTLPVEASHAWVPNEAFMVHVNPYLSPLWKMVLNIYSEFAMLQALSAETSDSASPLCKEKLGYLGQPVEDCFFFNYRKLNAIRPFVTPILAAYFESLHPKEIVSGSKDPNALQKLAPALLSLKNLVNLMQFGPGRGDFHRFLHPIGLVGWYGSPEVTMLESGQDAQKYFLSHRFIPLLKPQLTTISQNAAAMKPYLTAAQTGDLQIEIEDVRAKIEGIERDPLGLRQSFDTEAAPAGGAVGAGTKAGAASKE